MRLVAHISIVLTTLILTLFGTSGVMLTRCHCSGKVSVVMPATSGCCPTEGSCMEVRSMHLSDSELPTAQVVAHQLVPSEAAAIATEPISIYQSTIPTAARLTPQRDWHPPGRTGTTVEVLRV